MKKLEEENNLLTNESSTEGFSATPVPVEATKSSWHIALIVIGTLLGIPIFLVSAQIGGALGLAKAIPAFLAGSAVLCFLGCFTSIAGAISRYSTYKLSEFAFGRTGAKLVNLVIAVTLIGWFGVNGHVFGQAANLAVSQGLGVTLPISIYIVLGSILMIWISVTGFKGIDRLAFIIVPLMVLFIVYTDILTYDQMSNWHVTVDYIDQMSFSSATSVVIGSYIVGVVIQPDYSRFAKNTGHAVWSIVLSLGIGLPLVFILAAIPSVATGEVNLIQIMIALGIGVPAFLLLLLSTWSSNVVGLYSSGLSLSTIFIKTKLSRITIFAGMLGTALAMTKLQEYFIPMLISLGVVIPPIAAIYVIEILVVRRGCCESAAFQQEPSINIVAFVTWVVAAVIGFLSSQSYISLTGIASLDTVVAASCLYLIFRMRKAKDVWKTLKKRQMLPVKHHP